MTVSKKVQRRLKIKRRIRKRINGTSAKPRVSVYRSNTSIYAQVVDDLNGTTLASASSRQIFADKKSINQADAKQVGVKLAEMCIAKGITECVYDRNGFLYHGQVKALAEGVREGGVKL